MRPERARACVLALAVLLPAVAGSAQAPDSLAPPPPARPGELLPFRPGARTEPARAESARVGEARPDRPRATRVDLEEGRERGDRTLAGALFGRRPLLLDALPVYGPPLASVRLPDGSAPYRADDPWSAADGATDRSLVRLGRYGGIPGLAATLDDPEGTGADVLDDSGFTTRVEPASVEGASDALALLSPDGAADPLTRAGVPMPRRFRTTLVYRKGDGGELTTGVRFFSPTIGRGVMGSFARHATGGTESISRAVSNRYRATAGLPRALDHTLSLEGRLFRRTIEMPLAGSATPARAEFERASIGLRASGRSGSRSDAISLMLRREKRTDVPPPGSAREGWELPEVALQGDVSWGDSAGGSVLAGLSAASTRVSYRTGSGAEFDRKVESARITLGARRPLGPGGVGADVAYDVRKLQRSDWDARASGWVTAGSAAARLDVESVHERPTWIDLWTPFRADTVAGGTGVILYSRGGNPALRARRLTGFSGFGAIDAGRSVRLFASGAAHHVTRDFGWATSWDPGIVPYAVTDFAAERADGWASFSSLSCAVTAGPVSARAVGWVRGVSANLTPTSGSPPRRALDAEAGVRRRVFGGDLLARLSAAVHVTGSRRGLIREPARALWDAALELDFGAAGAVLGLDNVFDRAVGSGVLDIETGRAELLPARTFHFGIVWNLLD